MKIRPRNMEPLFNMELSDANPGDCIQFKKEPHQKHAADSLFVVLRVPSQYIERAERKPNGTYRIMVANVATGDCSLVAGDRTIRFVDAEVINNEIS